MRKGFISYSHADRAICDELFKHLGPLSRTHCRFWRDPDLESGDDWNENIGWHIARCHFAIVIVSADALKSGGFIPDIELPRLKKRVRKHSIKLIPVAARRIDRGAFEEFGTKEIVPLGPNKSLFFLGAGATSDEIDDWCATVAEQLRGALDVLPPVEEHSESVRASIAASVAKLREFEDHDDLEDVSGSFRNDIEKQMSGLKAALRAPAADIWFLVNAVTASWQRVVTGQLEQDSLSGLSGELLQSLAHLDSSFEENDYDWPPDKQRAELRGLVKRDDIDDSLETVNSSLDQTDRETNYLRQPGRQPAKEIAENITDKVAVARALADGEAIDGEGLSIVSGEIHAVTDAASVELQAALNLEGGQVDLDNVIKLTDANEKLKSDVNIVRLATPLPPDDETRRQWEKEAAVQIVMGQPIPAERRQFLQELSISGFDESLFKKLKDTGADLSELYTEPYIPKGRRKLLLSDLTPLKTLTQLTQLSCNQTQVSNLAPIKGLAQLTELSCGGTQVSDLTPIKELTQLTLLYCSETQVSDLTPLKELTKLALLNCSDTPVSDLTPLKKLTELTELVCYNTQVSDLTPLIRLTQLTKFDCDNTHVSDLTPLKDLTQLTRHYCENTQVTDWSPVDHIYRVFGRPDDWVRKRR